MHRGFIYRLWRDPDMTDVEHEAFCLLAERWLTDNEGDELSIAIASGEDCAVGKLAEDELYSIQPSGTLEEMTILARLGLAFAIPVPDDELPANVLDLIRRAREHASYSIAEDRDAERERKRKERNE